MTARAVLAGGLVSLAVWNVVTQSYDPFGDALDADKFEIKPNFDEKTSESRSHLDYGQARASTVVPKPTEITIELSAASAATLAMQFQGLVESITQGSGTLSAQSVTVPRLGDWISLGKRNISDQGFSVTEDDGTTVIANSHYEVNWSRGEIRFKSGVAPADVVKVTGAYGAVDGKKILGGRVTQVRCKARFDGKNLVDGADIHVDVHEAVLGSGNGFDFLAPDYSATKLSGKLVTPPGKTQPYEIDLPQATA